MNRFHFFVLILLILTLTPNLYADRSTPNGTVVEVVQALKRERSYSAVLDFMHWPTAFDNLKEEEKLKLGINSPLDLKTYLTKAVNDPKKIFTDLIKEQSKTLSEEQKKSMDAKLKEHLKLLDEEQSKLARKILETKFSITKTDVNNKSATVYLKAVNKNITETKPLNLIKSKGIWYLTTTNFSQ